MKWKEKRVCCRRIGLIAPWAILFFLIISLFSTRASSGERVVRDTRGHSFRVGRYERIVSLAPNISEILFFAGVGERVVGVTRYCNYPSEVLSLPKIGGISDPNLEKIIALDPELVIATKDGNPAWVIRLLEEGGIPCFVINPRTMDDILRDINKIALLTAASEKGKARIRRLGKEFSSLAGTENGEGVKVLFLYASSPLVGAGKGTFIDEVIGRAGGKNVLSNYRVPYPRLGLEEILSLHPEALFYVTGMDSGEGASSIARIESMMSGEKVKIVPLDSDMFTRPGPRLFRGLQILRSFLKESP